MSNIRVECMSSHDCSKSDSPIYYVEDKLYLNSNVKPNPGSVVQTLVRMVRDAYSYSTGGGEYNYYMELEPMRTKITTRYDNSGFIITMWFNGEMNSTHNWSAYPIRTFTTYDLDYTTYNYDISLENFHKTIFNHSKSTHVPNREWRDYVFGFTNPNGPEAGYSDYVSTPGSTRMMYFADNPRVPAGTDIYYGCVLQSSGSHQFTLNRCINNSSNGNYERGVSGVKIQEVSGMCNLTTTETGSEEYRFGDELITKDTTTTSINVAYTSTETTGLNLNDIETEEYRSEEQETFVVFNTNYNYVE